jgi:hypothetical protein
MAKMPQEVGQLNSALDYMVWIHGCEIVREF